MNHRLLGRRVRLNKEFHILNAEILAHFSNAYGGTIEAVHRDKDSQIANGYQVLVRNAEGKTKEVPLSILILEELDEKGGE